MRAHVRETCEILGAGGGYIVCSDQGITDDVPTDNVLAMYDALDG